MLLKSNALLICGNSVDSSVHNRPGIKTDQSVG